MSHRIRLKSDHFGIEIQTRLSQRQIITPLKSDHFGIEITHLSSDVTDLIDVKIRPFWD